MPVGIIAEDIVEIIGLILSIMYVFVSDESLCGGSREMTSLFRVRISAMIISYIPLAGNQVCVEPTIRLILYLNVGRADMLLTNVSSPNRVLDMHNPS